MQVVNTKQGRLTCPNPLGLKPCRSCQLLEFLNTVFIGVFSVESFSGLEFKGLITHCHYLPLLTNQVHFHSPLNGIVKGAMLKTAQIKITF
jgi:hypothetical protein